MFHAFNKSDFDKNHKTGRAKWKVPELFPDSKIAQAYLEPETNRDQAPFKWTFPSKEKVRKFCREVLGWTDAMVRTPSYLLTEYYEFFALDGFSN